MLFNNFVYIAWSFSMLWCIFIANNVFLVCDCTFHIVSVAMIHAGFGVRAVKTLQQMLEVYPEGLDLRNDLGVKFLLIGKNEDARHAFQQVINLKH